MKTNSYEIVELRGASIEYKYQYGFPSQKLAQELADAMNFRARTDDTLMNGDGNPFNYIVKREED